MGFLSMLFRTGKLNADPEQQALAAAMIDSVENNRGFATRVIFEILVRNNWSPSEQRNRIAHAASMVKVYRADLYPKVKEMARHLYATTDV